MKSTKYTIPLLVLALLIPVRVNNAMSQEMPGVELETNDVGQVGVVNELTALDSILDDYLDALEIEQDTKHKEFLDTAVTRLEIVKAMMQVSKNSTDIAIQYQGLTVQELLDLLDHTYGPDDYPATNSADNLTYTNIDTLTDNVHIDTISFVSHSTPQIDVLKNTLSEQNHYDCVDRREITGSVISVLKSYTDGTATITGSFDYPEDMNKNIRERRTTECLNFDHVKTVKRHDVLMSLNPSEQIAAQICTLTATNPSDEKSVGCNAYGANTLTAITTHNTYDGTDTSRSTQLGTTSISLLLTRP